MAVKGIFVSDAGGLNERQDSLSSTVLREQRGGSVPFFALSAGMSSENLNTAVYSWYEEGMWSTRGVIVAINAPTGNMITVDDTSWIHENMIFQVETTGEQLLVLGVSGNALTVQRNIGSTGVTPIVLGGSEIAIQLIGTAFEEGSERPTAIATSPYLRWNQCQIFRRAWDITGTAQATTYRFGDRQARNKADAAMWHAEDMERSFLWGRMHSGVINNKPFRMMDGVLAQLRSNIFVSPASGLDRRALDDYTERLFSKNIKGKPNERITFCGNVTLRALNEIAYRYGEYSVSPVDNTFGLDFYRFRSQFGTLTFMVHPMMNENPIWSRDMYSFHPAAMSLQWLRRTFHQDGDEQGRASDLRDGTAGVFTSEVSVKYGLEQTGAIMTDISADYYDPRDPQAVLIMNTAAQPVFTDELPVGP